jgi:membrane dipeptidase
MGIPAIPRRRPPGLTEFGHAVIEKMNSLGIIIDVSHSDRTTVLDIVRHTRRPVIASHAGAHRIDGFERFLADDEIVAIAGTGGLIGLWTYHYKGHGPVDINALMRHARHIAGLAGAAHLCIGTDINGVPGTLGGFRRESDLRLIAAHLRLAGFGQAGVQRILGGNFMRVFAEVLPPSPDDPRI